MLIRFREETAVLLQSCSLPREEEEAHPRGGRRTGSAARPAKFPPQLHRAAGVRPLTQFNRSPPPHCLIMDVLVAIVTSFIKTSLQLNELISVKRSA